MVNIQQFLNTWHNEVEKILFRLSKELGCYSEIKKTLNPENKINRNDVIIEYYYKTLRKLNRQRNKQINFYYKTGLNRAYIAYTALKSPRHFSQLCAYYLLENSNISSYKKNEIFVRMDELLYKNHKFITYITEKWHYIKLLLTLQN